MIDIRPALSLIALAAVALILAHVTLKAALNTTFLLQDRAALQAP